MTHIFGMPGTSPTIALASSCSVKSTRPPLIFSAYFMNMSFMAFSLLQVPHIMAMMLSVPSGAILINTSCTTQSAHLKEVVKEYKKVFK